MKDFTKQVKFEDSLIRFTIEIEYKDDRLSITGDGREKVKGRWHEWCGGQVYDELFERFPESTELVEIWKRWHLNDLNAGDPIQESYLRVHGRGKDYEESCSILFEAGLLEHNGYKYGTAWKFETVPEYILKKLRSF